MIDKWQFYSQAGVDGPEYGIRIRPGYVVVGFQKEDAKEIIGLRDEVKRLRSEIEIDNKLLADRDRIYEVCQCPVHGSCTPYVIEQLKSIPEKDARIKELEAAFLEAKRCPTCNGAGKLIDVVISRKLGRVESERVCPLCEGKWEEKAREALEQIKEGGKDDGL